MCKRDLVWLVAFIGSLLAILIPNTIATLVVQVIILIAFIVFLKLNKSEDK